MWNRGWASFSNNTTSLPAFASRVCSRRASRAAADNQNVAGLAAAQASHSLANTTRRTIQALCDDRKCLRGRGGGTRATEPERKRVCIVIPAYNEAATIGEIVRLCRAVVDASCIFVVDDGSLDDTGVIAACEGARVLRHPANRGKGASLMNGMRLAMAQGATSIVTLDGDGQHRPEDIARLLACSQTWPRQIVIGSRRASRRAAPRARFMANRVADSGYPGRRATQSMTASAASGSIPWTSCA